MGIPITVGLKKADRERIDTLLGSLKDFQSILNGVRSNEEIVIKISLRPRNKWKDDIRK